MATCLKVIERHIQNYLDRLFSILSSDHEIFTHEYVALELSITFASLCKKKEKEKE